MMFKILVLILLIPFNAFGWGMLNQMDAGTQNSSCSYSSSDNLAPANESVPNAIYTSSFGYAQSFVAPASGTDVIVSFISNNYNGTGLIRVYLDNDWDFTADLFGTAYTNITATGTTYCVNITSSSSLTEGNTYYVLFWSDGAYGDRITIKQNSSTNQYSAGAMRQKNVSSGTIDFSGESNATKDLNFRVSVGEGCSCP